MEKMIQATASDQQVWLQFNMVSQLIKPGTALFAPGIFLRVMKQALFNQRP